jgi:hypothetical protein
VTRLLAGAWGGVALALVSLELPGQADPVSADRAAIDAEPDRTAPFYDANGATMRPPPAPPRHRPQFLIVGSSVDISEVFIPDLSSGGVLVEPMFQIGNDIAAGGIGYANLARAHGIDLELSFGRWASAVRIFDAHGWLGTWLLPDVDVRLACFPGQPAPPSWISSLQTRVGGVRAARCLHGVCLTMSAAATVGPALLELSELHGGVVVGGHIDLGFAFWR